MEAGLEEDIPDRMEELRKRKETCMKECSAITKELADLEEFEQKNEIANISLSPDKKLIDLLVHRILDPSPDWKSKIDTLIRIPNSMKGDALKGGSYFEALFQLAIAIGEMPQFKSVKQFYDIKGYKTQTKLDNYLYTKTIKNAGGGETGIADIMFEIDFGKGGQSSSYSCGEILYPQKVIDNPFYFISVKGFKKEKSISQSYDIPLLDKQISIFPEIKNKHIVVCVRNKKQFMTRLGRTKQDFLKNSIDHVIGYDEVMDIFDTFRTRFFVSLGNVSDVASIETRVKKLFPETETAKPGLSLYFHQELVVKSVASRLHGIADKNEPHFMCIGVLPRGGKSYIAGGIINEHRRMLQKKTPYNVLFLTSAISETMEQFDSDLINKFSEFSDFTFIDPRPSKKTVYDKNKNSFVFMSRQLSTQKIKIGITEVDKGEEEDISFPISDIVKLLEKNLGEMPNFDICFFDEAHIGIGSTNVRNNFLKAFNEFKMPVILMSATYAKPALVLSDNKDLFVWDLQDIKDMKELPVIGFDGFIAKKPDVITRYPDLAKQILDFRRTLGETEEQIARPYVNFPNPNFISLTFTPPQIQKFVETGDGYDFRKAFGFNMGSLDLLNHDKYTEWGKLLTNREEAMRIRQFLTPEEEEPGFLQGPDRKYRAFNQIFRISQQTGSRPVAGQPFSVLMFLPTKAAGPIGKLCRVWASFLYESKYWRDNFVFLTLSAYNDKKYRSYPKITPELAVKRGICHREDFKTPLKQTITNIEQEALKNGKGLVILSGDVAKMGISLKCVDVVCLLTDTTGPDDIIQKMYRALTDDPPSKKNGFIVDLNIKRIISAMFGYAMEKARRNPESTSVDTNERMNSLFELCNWGQDAFIEDEAAQGKTLEMIKKDIDIRILNDLIARTHDSHTKSVADKQVSIIFDNPSLKQEVFRVLKNTRADKGATTETVVERNTDVPDASNAIAVATVDQVPSKEVSSQEIQLTEAQIKAKMSDILLTFINTVVIKSSNKWGTKFSDLIQKFEADKPTATKACDCSLKTECKVPHTNLYDITYCELRPYAYSPSNAYIQGIHEGIMNLISRMFQQSSQLAPDWQVYIDGLTRELSSKRGGRHKSWKKRLSKSNGRKTHRNGA
jgi:hypothetical protein